MFQNWYSHVVQMIGAPRKPAAIVGVVCGSGSALCGLTWADPTQCVHLPPISGRYHWNLQDGGLRNTGPRVSCRSCSFKASRKPFS